MRRRRAEQKDILFEFVIVIEPDGDEFYAYCPTLEGLHVSGRTKEEALENARDAAAAYLESLIVHGDPIPIGARAPGPQRSLPYYWWSPAYEHIERVALPV